jgi:hypothetical protein
MKSTALFELGGPKPPAAWFVQFRTVDQFVSAPAGVQRSVPGFANVLLTSNVTVALAVPVMFVPKMVSA